MAAQLSSSTSPVVSAKNKDKEAKRALKWSRVIASWQQVKKKKDTKLQVRVYASPHELIP